jgi:formate hydrogenlyase subunit 3/multisubunit Na+/H+ antiporter MnhD subunit
MLLTGKNDITRRKTCPSTVLYTTNLTGTGLESRPGLRDERQGTNSPSHGMPLPCTALTSRLMLYRMPMFMVHLWLPKAHVEAPVSGSIILAGVLLKLP